MAKPKDPASDPAIPPPNETETEPDSSAVPHPHPELKPEPAIPPATDPEHGDLTPAFVQWYAETHSKVEFRAKYGSRLGLIPVGIRQALEGGAA